MSPHLCPGRGSMAPCLLPLLLWQRLDPCRGLPVPLSADAHLAYPMPHDGNMVLGMHALTQTEWAPLWEGTAPAVPGKVWIICLSNWLLPTCTMQLWGDLGKECVYGEGRWAVRERSCWGEGHLLWPQDNCGNLETF